MKLTEVAAAVIERRAADGAMEFLLGQRAPGTFYPGYWEFPGGKVEAGETPHAALLREHIIKEDRVLYPLADRILTQEQQHALEEGFEHIERDVVGEGRHEAFHRMLDELEGVYLGSAQSEQER